jgi:cell division protein FtsB
MLRPQKIFLSYAAGFVLSAMLLFIVFGDNGLKDLFALKRQRNLIAAQNEKILNENISLYRQVKRLENDPQFIEAMARKELCVIGADERVIQLK